MIKRKIVSCYEESVYIYDAITGIDVAILTKHFSDSNEIMYTLRVDWDAYDKLENPDTIPGYDMDLRYDEYVRDDYTVFMTEYLPPACRPDSKELMLSVNLDMPYDMWAFMIEQGRNCMDGWRVRRIPGAVYSHDKFKINKS